jgi:hypothetical protein
MEKPIDVFILVPDLFARSKIIATGKALGIALRVLDSPGLLSAELPKEARSLVIVDLTATLFDPMEVAVDLRRLADPHRATLVGIYPHVDKPLRQRAVAAGYDHVLPRSLFARDLARILVGDFAPPLTSKNQ